MISPHDPRAPWLASLLSGLLLWMAFPPFDLPWLAWLAPIPWLWLVRATSLSGRWPYLAIWVGGLLHWLLMLQGIRLAHVALYAGWFALAAYVAIYIPVFVAITRVAVHSARWPLFLAAPVIWTGLELAKGHLITGFSMGLLGHTQANFPRLLQPADFGGAYATSFLIILIASALAETIWSRWPRLIADEVSTSNRSRDARTLNPTRTWPWAALATAAGCLLATWLYSHYRLREARPDEHKRSLKAALIQGSLDTVLATSYEEQQKRFDETFVEYQELTRRTLERDPGVQLVVWPESMFAAAERMGIDLAPSPRGFDRSVEEFRHYLRLDQQAFERRVSQTVDIVSRQTASNPSPAWFLCGSTTIDHSAAPMRVYNSALLMDHEGRIVDRYYKTHPVMFGEYIPFGEMFPWIYDLAPIGGGISVGDGPRLFEVADMRLSPSICFENTVPHLIRRQVAKLNSEGKSPDLLVNDSNDGWFKGSSMLDLHLRCAVFRSIENRKPMLIAANTGLSAWIDGNGVIQRQGLRRKPSPFVVEARPDGRTSLYTQFGDIPAGLCLLITVGLALFGIWKRRKMPVEQETGE